MATSAARHRSPATGRHQALGKRDQIVNVFLRQEGHLSADDLVDLIKREDQRISRATVYRTLQWMVDAGIARKVDFGEGRFRFEHSYRHPRHFHLICKTCNRSYEFLSSDIEALVEEIATARGFTARQSVVQIYGTLRIVPHRASRRPKKARRASCSSPATRCALRLPPSAAGSSSTPARRGSPRIPRGRQVFQSLAEEEKHHLERRSNSATSGCSIRIRSSNHVRRSCSSRARRTACSRAAPTSCCATASTISRRTRSAFAASAARTASSRRYGERFEDSEGKQIFLEFAEEERDHLEMLIREYRALTRRQRKRKAKPGRAGSTRGASRHAASR